MNNLHFENIFFYHSDKRELIVKTYNSIKCRVLGSWREREITSPTSIEFIYEEIVLKELFKFLQYH